MTTLLSDAALLSLRGILDRGLSHTCMLSSVTSGPPDDWGNETTQPGTPVEIRCLFVTVQRAIASEAGAATVSVPLLHVSPSTVIATDDLVTDVTDQLGVLLAPGPFEVQRLYDDTAGLGAPLLPVWELKATDVEMAP